MNEATEELSWELADEILLPACQGNNSLVLLARAVLRK